MRCLMRESLDSSRRAPVSGSVNLRQPKKENRPLLLAGRRSSWAKPLQLQVVVPIASAVVPYLVGHKAKNR